MFTRIRIAAGFALLAILVTSISAYAKGGFAFITITGPNLKGEIRSEDLALTEDFFSFADLYRNKTSAPADPGTGYEVTRYYIEGQGEIAFDRLHYYPESGLVFYDGIVNGSSEYDGEWYTAKSEIKPVFEKALAGQLTSQASSLSQPPLSLPPFYWILLTILGIAALGLFSYRFRKSLT